MRLLLIIILSQLILTEAQAVEQRTLIKMDHESKVKMLAGMRTYLRLTQDMIEAFTRDDFKKIEIAADKMSLNPTKQENIYKKNNTDFVRRALEFHGPLVENIKSAAKAHDKNKVVSSLNLFLRSCVECHDLYRVN